MKIAKDLRIDEEYYDEHEAEFFVIFNSEKKEEKNWSSKDKKFRIFFDGIRSGNSGRLANFVTFFKNETIEKFWNAQANGLQCSKFHDLIKCQASPYGPEDAYCSKCDNPIDENDGVYHCSIDREDYHRGCINYIGFGHSQEFKTYCEELKH